MSHLEITEGAKPLGYKIIIVVFLEDYCLEKII